jgi:hypothetical protein
MYLATVTDTADPLQQQRIKVTVPGLLEGANESLPWVMPLHPSLFGTGATYGQFGVPPVGAKVIVYFQGDDLLYGVTVGTVPMQSADLGPLKENYPMRYGWRDPAANYFYVDTTPGATTVKFEHKSGTTIEIADNGTIAVFSKMNVTVNVTEQAVIQTGKDATLYVMGNLSATVLGNAAVQVGGNLSASASGSGTLNFGGGLTTAAPSWSHTGPLALAGTLAVTGAMTAASVRETTTNIGLSTHVHAGVESGNNFTNPPS